MKILLFKSYLWLIAYVYLKCFNYSQYGIQGTISQITGILMSAKNEKHDTENNSINWDDYLKSGNRIFIGSNAAVPNALIDNLIANSN